ncbi:ThiF family adenylyltransferase [Desulfomicrobium sp. ZS1]|uniref:HesA/MoeB/ThiF family protein n=1 Tax=Desulfomicrobium sp. ZS1 TaxID=2952228 RepID=UPI0020B29B0E|nr:ThiF family adenylyltransferase [Desulfomicrobium sp. ZS1]UTF49684.1 ThiF family adenylyltransferase [Desulfomicrobium sp. ZS1]
MKDFRVALEALASENASRRVRTVGFEELRQLCRDHGLTLPQGARGAMEEGVVPLPFLKNLHSLSISEQNRLMGATVLLAGAGGLGGYVLELLSRFGVGRIVVADGDGFEDSNLNRQLLSTVQNLGSNKARAGAERVRATCPLVQVEAFEFFLDASNLQGVLTDVDVVVDALGGIAPRLALHEAACLAGIPVVSAAVAGWTALVGSELPGQKGISSMWTDPSDKDAEHVLGSLAPAACLAAALQAAETVQYLTTGSLRLAGRMLHADLAEFHFELYDLS